ncbi:MAG: hypothetical protein ACREEQ_03285, partial [Caulobacteraceae bacterium]
RGRAARERGARELAGGAVRFVTEAVGPAFATREAALDAYAGKLDDDRPSRLSQPPPEDRYCALAERFETRVALRPVEPAFAEGRRWPARPPKALATVWRLTISYWRLVRSASEAPAPDGQARELRRKADSAPLDAAQVRALAHQPLRPVKPQQPLDVGLFEAPAPEAPHILIPDD